MVILVNLLVATLVVLPLGCCVSSRVRVGIFVFADFGRRIFVDGKLDGPSFYLRFWCCLFWKSRFVGFCAWGVVNT